MMKLQKVSNSYKELLKLSTAILVVLVLTFSNLASGILDEFGAYKLAENFKIKETQAAAVGDAFMIYDETTPTTNVQERAYTIVDDTVSGETSPFAGSGASKHVRMRSSETRDEMLLGIQDSAGTLTVYKKSATGTWASQWTVTVGDGNLQRFDIAYEQTSGDALVVYSGNTATDGQELQYYTWNGTTWTGPTNLGSARTTGTVYGLKLSSRTTSGTDEIGLVYADTNFDLSANVWTGAAWYGEPSAALATSLSKIGTNTVPTNRAYDLTFESLSGDLMVIWGVDATADPRYVIKPAGGAWGSTVTATNLIEEPTNLDIASSPISDKIGYANNTDNGSDCDFAIWSGSAWGTGVNDTSCGTLTVGDSSNNVEWLVDGANEVAIYTYRDSAAGGIDWYTSANGGQPTLQTDNTLAPAVAGLERFGFAKSIAGAGNKALFAFGDANADIFIKEATLSGTTVTWSNPVGISAAIETDTSVVAFNPFSLSFVKFVPAVTTLGSGTDPGSTTIAPGVSITDAGQFTFQTSAGSDSITQLNVTLAGSGTPYDGVSEVRITSSDDLTTYYSAITNPTSNALTFSGGTAIPASAGAATFKIRITPKTHANMPAVPGASYALSPYVSNWTGTNTHAGSDANANTLTIDNTSPNGATSVSGSAGNAAVTVNWTTSNSSDFNTTSGSVIYRWASGTAGSEVPTEGSTPTTGSTNGTATVACVISSAASTAQSKVDGTGGSAGCTTTALTNGQAYTYKAFQKDTNGNYDAGVLIGSFTPTAPANVTTIADGANPGNSTVAPSSTITDLDAFTLSTNSGTDSVTALTVTLTGTNSFESLSEVRITSSDGATLYFATVAPTSNTVSFSGGTAIPVSTTATTFKVRITPKTHANMPVPPGLSYGVGGTVTAFTSTNTQSGTDTGSATITVDNLSPNGATSVSGSAGDTANTVNWTTSNSADFNTTSGSVILRWASASAGSEVPAEGSTYSTGNTIGTATVACVISSAASTAQSKVDGTGGSAGCTTTALTNGQAYTYKAFQKDTNGNYDVGVTIGTFTPERILTIGVTAGAKVTNLNSGDTSQYAHVTSCTGAATCAAFTFSLNSGSETITSIKILELGTADATNNLANLALFYDTDGNWADAGAETLFGTVADFAADQTAVVSGSLAISSGTTYYFYVRFDLAKGGTYPVGGQTVNFRITSNADVTVSGTSTKTGAPAVLAGTTTLRPQITGYTNSTESGLNYAASCTGCGARIGGGSGFRQTVVISGYGFGADPGLGSRDTSTNKVEVVGAATTMLVDDASANTNVSAWSNTSITMRTDTAITGNADTDWGANFGGTSALKITAGGQAVPTNLNFYIFPQITSITQPSGFPADSAREYNAADTDGIITLNGTRFGTGTTGGSVTILSNTANTTSWGNTAITAQVPTAISNSVYTGNVAMTQGTGSNNKTHTYTSTGFRILPRITGNSPTSGLVGDTIQLAGDHFCQTGTCPVSPNRSSATDNVKFGSTQAADADFQNLTGGAGACNGTGAAWNHSEICVKVPTGAPTGSQPTIVKSNSYDSNTQAFTVISATPSDPTLLDQFKDSGLTQSIAVGGTASATPIYLKQTMEVTGVSGGTLYPQFEYQPTGTAFVCGAGACASAVEGTGSAGPGPVTGSKSISPTDGTYHWQARTRHNKNSVDYYSNWVSFGGNAEPSGLDFNIDTTGPAITSVNSDNIGSNSARVIWDTLTETGTSQVQYNKTGTFGACSGDCTTIDSNLVNAHIVNLSNLDSGTLYYYRVRSKDAAGNESISSNSTFTTATVSDPSKTVKFHIVGNVGSITNASPLSQSFSVFMTENSTTTRNAFVVITGVYDAAVASPTLTVQVNSEASKTYILPTVVSKNHFKIIHRVNGITIDPGTNTLTVTPDTNTTVYVSSADIDVTYSYTP